MTHHRLPVVKAFLVCDTVIQDVQTGKKTLIGLFHEIKASVFPTAHPELWIYANLTDAQGEYTFEIRFVDVATGQLLGKGTPPPIKIADPRQTTELSAQLRHVALPHPGLFEFQLVANGQLAATKAVRVGLVPAPQAPDAQAPDFQAPDFQTPDFQAPDFLPPDGDPMGDRPHDEGSPDENPRQD